MDDAMGDGTIDGRDGWKGTPPPDRPRILYIKDITIAFFFNGQSFAI